ncbi:MAG: phosphatase PAP2 family protein [Candidatus Cloacimonetes bacterium]|nr:phosphatase PAP2 family protein [Candidatus Cloacimonadota bacterium]
MGFNKKIFITDWLMFAYIIFTIVWILIGWENIAEIAKVSPLGLLIKICGISSLIIFLLILNHFTKNPIIQFLRFWYPIFLLEFFYITTTYVHFMFFPEIIDPFFQYLDEMIFGYQPSMVWGTSYDEFFYQEFFHFAYFSYYLMIFGIPFYIYIKKEKKEFIRALFNIMFVFLTCYVMFMILPVVGGRAVEGMRELIETYRHGLFTHIMVFIYKSAEHWGAAFPSSHVAVALTITLVSFRHFKLFGLLLLVNTFFLSWSTVFCHYHYFVDVISGVLFGLIMFFISEVIYAIFGAKKEKYIE